MTQTSGVEARLGQRLEFETVKRGVFLNEVHK